MQTVFGGVTKYRKYVPVVLAVVGFAVIGGVLLQISQAAENASTSAAAAETSFAFTAAGDHKFSATSKASMDAVATSGSNFYVALGDFSYAAGSEASWCQTFKSKFNDVELLAGNHDVGESTGGNIDIYRQHCPFTLGKLTGDYGKQYYFDYPQTTAPLARFIMIAPGLKGSININYSAGGAGYNFTKNAIDEAQAAGIKWIVVGMHKNCISVGNKTCEVGTDIMNLLITEKVDLILQSHDHNYQRSHALKCLTVNTVNNACIGDNGSDGKYAKGDGPVILINGEFGATHYAVNSSDSEAGYFAAMDSTTFGISKFTITSTSIQSQYLRSAGGSFADSFAIAEPSGDSTAPTVSLTEPKSGTTVTTGTTAAVSASAADNVGVSRVEFYIDGILKATDMTSPHSYSWDTTGIASGTHTVKALAFDAAGNMGSSAEVSVTVSNPNELVFTPTDDATIIQASGSSNYGNDVFLQTDTNPVEETLLKMTVSGTAGKTIETAKLRLYVVNASDGGGNFYKTGTAWDQSTVTYNTVPATGEQIATTGAARTNSWQEIDVKSLVNGDGTFALRIKSNSPTGDGADYSSLEGVNMPQLIITTATTTSTSGDIDGDTRVNAIDLSTVISKDGQNYPPADLNRDGTVEAGDMAIVLSRWTW